jgi:hypothetical protein
VLWTSALYVLIWLAFWVSPPLQSALLAVPVLGPAVSWFTALYVFALIVYVVWWLIWTHWF